MVKPQKARKWHSKSNNKPMKVFRLVGAIITSTLVTFFLFGSVKDTERIPSALSSLQKIDDSLAKLESSYEEMFLKTIHSCVSSEQINNAKNTAKNCQQYVPTGTKSLQRIAIASPPGIHSETFTTILHRSLLQHYYNGDTETMQNAMDLVQISHVPPYGYGKTHGWTKIVRLVGRPTLLQEVFDSINWITMQNGANAIGKEGSHRIDDLSQVLRQVIRWHCRISHVAAHTALFSFDFSGGGDLEDMLLQLVKFLVSTPGNGDVADMEKVKRITEEIQPEIATLAYSNSDALTAFFTEKDIIGLQDVLIDEFQKSDNLKKWPCLSFWDVAGKGDGSNSRSSLVAFVSKRLAKSLAPKCNEPFSECTVKKDRCEERGDILCK